MRKLGDAERLHYRDRFRAARYAALADAEGFEEICFALEALGLRLFGRQADLGKYEDCIGLYARRSPQLCELTVAWPTHFKAFDALYRTVRNARNDAMHIGAYARHATEAAIELCIGLEEALMADVKLTVGGVMVSSPVVVEHWHPVAHARQLMLRHSFSFLPVRLEEKWWLVSELGLARFLSANRSTRVERLGMTIAEAAKGGLDPILIENDQLLTPTTSVAEVLDGAGRATGPMLWLVVDDRQLDRLAGVLSPFELM